MKITITSQKLCFSPLPRVKSARGDNPMRSASPFRLIKSQQWSGWNPSPNSEEKSAEAKR